MSEAETTAAQRRAWHRRRDLRFLMIVAGLVALYFGYGYATGPSRISQGLQQALEAGPERVNIVVTAKFPPEEFHLGVFQDVGAMRGSEGNSSTLYRVKPADIRKLSRYYWIERIDLAPPQQ